MSRSGKVITLALGVGLLPLAACTHIVAHATPYYEEGPGQLAQPQGNLSAGTWVMIVGSEGSYAHVLTATLVNAWIWRDALEPIWSYRARDEGDWQQKWEPDDGAIVKPDAWRQDEPRPNDE